MKISVQTYTIRKLAKQNLNDSLKKVKALGYQYLEVARVPFTIKTADKILNNNLEVLSIQVKYKVLKKHFSKIVTFCKRTNCKIVVVSVLPLKAIIGGTRANIAFAHALNKLALMYQSKGITLAFHHHNFEFKILKGGTKFDYLLKTFSEDIKIVVDTYWVRVVGIEPQNFIKYLGNRVIGVHLRDYQRTQKGNKFYITDTEIGNGSIDFKKVFEVASVHAIYGAVEQNTSTPIQSLEKSLNHINKIM